MTQELSRQGFPAGAQVLVLDPYSDRYHDVVELAMHEPDVLAYAKAAADCEVEERLDKTWVVCLNEEDQVMAWCAFQPAGDDDEAGQGIEVRCVDSVALPRAHGTPAYEMAYAVRQVLTCTSTCVTYVHENLLTLHRRTGWCVLDSGERNDLNGTPVRWFKMLREAESGYWR